MLRSSHEAGPRFAGKRLAAVLLLSLGLAAAADHIVAWWLGWPTAAATGAGTYRRVGPATGRQVFCAGSSVLVWGLTWSVVAESLGQGIENWGVGGSSPDIWEVFQRQAPESDLAIIGVSLFDLNEMRLAEDRARVVPLSQTLEDLWASGAESALSRRVLTQYLLNCARILFPTAGQSDRVMVGVRRKASERLGQVSAEDREDVLFQPSAAVLDFGEYTTKVSDWPPARILRRLAALRSENRGRHEFFKGPKRRGLQRMLRRAQQQGRVIVVVMPLPTAYLEEFVDARVAASFEQALDDAMATVPGATLVRLDRVPGITSHRYFADLVHLNSFGRQLATRAYLAAVGEHRRP